MEIRLTIKLVILWKTIILLGIIVLLSACFHSEKEAVPSIGIVPDEHMLLAITPDFSIKMAGDALNKHYLLHCKFYFQYTDQNPTMRGLLCYVHKLPKHLFHYKYEQ